MIRARAFALFAALALAGCPTAPEADPTLCTDLLEEQAGCMNDANFEQCEEANAECPGEVVVLESCPLQFACGG